MRRLTRPFPARKVQRHSQEVPLRFMGRGKGHGQSELGAYLIKLGYSHLSRTHVDSGCALP